MEQLAVLAHDGEVRVDSVPFTGLYQQAGPGVSDRGFLPHAVVLEVLGAGVCGSDLSALAHQELGTVCGHEVVGVVTEVGPEVSTIVVGDVVAAAFNVACGRCHSCLSGLTSLCEVSGPGRRGATYGLGHAVGGWLGFQAERVTVPWADHNLVRLPGREWAVEHLGAAILLTDVLPTAMHAVAQSEAGVGTSVYVAGAGPVGLFTGWLAQRSGASVVIGDLRPDRRSAAQSMGLVAIDPRHGLADQLESTLGVRQVDAVLDCVGGAAGKDPLDLALAVLAPAGCLVLVGVHAGPGGPTIAVESVWRHAWTIRGGATPARGLLNTGLEHVVSGDWPIERLVSIVEVPLRQAPDAYARFAGGAGEKFVLVP